MREGDDDLSSIDGDLEDAEISGLSDDDEDSNETPEETLELDKFIQAKTDKPERKRKRKNDEQDLEGKYLEKLAREEEKEEEERQAERRLKRQKLAAEQNLVKEATEEGGSDEEMEDAESDDEVEIEEETDESNEESHRRKTPSDVPIHESLVPNKDATELEKASRTIFLGNVASSTISSKADKKTLMSHLSSFIDDLPPPPSGKPSHKLESLRFRSTAYATSALPKKAAFAKKDIMTATTKSTNAYAVYSTSFAAREAVKRLNGTMVLDRHLRVDGVAHPAKTDHRRCVFVGNLGFVDDESLLEQDGENSRKRSKIPSDIEEGLWRQFGKAGEVESVRVIRDEKTRVGKGFAYVQFKVSFSFHLTTFEVLLTWLYRMQMQLRLPYCSMRKSIHRCFLEFFVLSVPKPNTNKSLPDPQLVSQNLQSPPRFTIQRLTQIKPHYRVELRSC